MMKPKFVLFAFCAWTGLYLCGCNRQDTENLKRDVGTLAKSSSKAAENAALAGKVNAKLATTKGISMSGLHVEAENGTVTLGGHVRDKAERDRVLHTVQETTGVEKVVSNLRIQPEDKPQDSKSPSSKGK